MFNIFTIETKKNAAILRAMVLIIVAMGQLCQAQGK